MGLLQSLAPAAMRIASLLALAALLASPAHSQVRIGADLGGVFSPGNTFRSSGLAGGFSASAEWRALRLRLGVLDASYQSTSTVALNDDGSIFIDGNGLAQRIENTGSSSLLASTVTAGVAVPVYRGAGVGLDVGIRIIHGEVTTGTARPRDLSWSPVIAPELFAPGPRGTRLHLRSEVWPPSRSIVTGEKRGIRLFQLRGGVSVPLGL